MERKLGSQVPRSLLAEVADALQIMFGGGAVVEESIRNYIAMLLSDTKAKSRRGQSNILLKG